MHKKEITAFIIDFLFILSAAFMWSQARMFYTDPFFWLAFDDGFWLPVLMQIIAITAVVTAGGMLSALRIPLALSSIAYVFGAITAFFFLPITVTTAASATVFVTVCILFDITSKRAVQNYIRLSWWDTLRPALSRFIFYCVLCISIGYYQATAAGVASYQFTMPDGFAQDFIRLLVQGNPEAMQTTQTQTMETLLKDETYINSVVNDQIEAQGLEADDLTQEQREDLRNEVIKQLRRQAESSNSETMDEETFISLVKTQIEDQMNGLIREYQSYVPLVSTFLFITALGFLNLPAVAAGVGIVHGIVFVLNRMQIIHIQKEERLVERVEW